MDKDLVQGSVGPEAKYDVAFVGGQLVASLDYSGKELGGSLAIKIPVKAVLDAIAAKIPGTLDDSIIKLIEAGLGL